MVHVPFVPSGYWSPCAPLVWNQGFPTPLGGLSMSTNSVNKSDILFSSSQFRKQVPRHENAVSRNSLTETIYAWPRESISRESGLSLFLAVLSGLKVFKLVTGNTLRTYNTILTLLGRQTVWVNSRLSRWKTVLSSVPQGTVLAPVIFNLHVDDFPSLLSSSVLLYADNVRIWRAMKSDSLELQNNPEKLSQWSKIWQLTINVPKCILMHIGHQGADT
ncbi:unnamed protein product [Schistosoma margrebowiei]|uniref:Reverse transcriptase domain-containing protein n=1 Tax=Schistosoma margrebowiei TaxID=48269 RepID=A0A3P7XPI9_9TREM|nr:unnamed protein product [Schistosoma margrebowiei]